MLSTFLDEISNSRAGIIDPARLGAALKMPLSQIARITHLHRNTLARHPDSPKVQERLGVIARIVTEATELCGSPGQAVIWFRYQPLAGFDGHTAQELVEEGMAPAVLDYLRELRDGAYA